MVPKSFRTLKSSQLRIHKPLEGPRPDGRLEEDLRIQG
jgi:hypothetical protein